MSGSLGGWGSKEPSHYLILGTGRSDIFLSPHPNPPPPGGRGPWFAPPPGGGGRNKAPSPLVGEGETKLPPPWWGREKQSALPHQGGGRTKAPSPLVGEGWGGGGNCAKFNHA